jgi:membrane carboxypeptidase/penicillin-binding protein
VGFDDNRELNLEGAKSALPIWAELMKRAAKMRPYRDVKMFSPPSGVVTAPACVPGGLPDAGGSAVSTLRTEVFISGTEPAASCETSVAPAVGVADRVVDPVTSAATVKSTPPAAAHPAAVPPATAPPSPPATAPKSGDQKTLPVTSGGRG